MKGIVADIVWNSSKVFLTERPFLICFGEKGMSGKVERILKLSEPGNYEVDIAFISPDFFIAEARVGEAFTVREASTVLGKGVVIKII